MTRGITRRKRTLSRCTTRCRSGGIYSSGWVESETLSTNVVRCAERPGRARGVLRRSYTASLRALRGAAISRRISREPSQSGYRFTMTIVPGDQANERGEPEVLGTSTLSESPNTEVIPNQLLTSADGATDCRLVVHRSPIGARLLVRLTHKRSICTGIWLATRSSHRAEPQPTSALRATVGTLRASRERRVEAPPGFEPGMEVLQTVRECDS